MNVWAISDLHLSFGRPERRDRFAERWRDHAEKIERGWRSVVRPGDVVLLPGDLSMARNHRELQPDLQWLGALPGTKVLAPGNHDRWWNATDAVRRLLRRSMVAVGGDAAEVRGLIVCGTRGTPVPADDPTEADRIAAERELALLDRALAQAAALREADGLWLPIYVLWHYPPFDSGGRPSPCVERFERAGVAACVYGHLHIQAQWSLSVQGVVRGVRYHCVAADAVGFQPLRVGSLPDPSLPRR
ncbi:MAG: metallophosphoesterase [Isosphaeraceae bacterium]